MPKTATVRVDVAGLPQVKDAMNQAVRAIDRLENERHDLRHLLQQWEQRVSCLQCGQRYSERACGPTHALIAHLVSGGGQ